ncbi:MAG: hypothetical protein AABX70_07570 [Nanoarchaeota archaeon]
MSETEILKLLKEIQANLQHLQSDMDAVKKAVVTEAEFEEQELDLDKEMQDLTKPDPGMANEVRYKEETLDEVEKEMGN